MSLPYRYVRKVRLGPFLPEPAAWIGHSVKVQNDNYAQVADHHFEKAAEETLSGVVRQVVQYGAKSEQTEANTKTETPAEPVVLRGNSQLFASVRKRKVAVEGLEPPTRGL